MEIQEAIAVVYDTFSRTGAEIAMCLVDDELSIQLDDISKVVDAGTFSFLIGSTISWSKWNGMDIHAVLSEEILTHMSSI